MIGNITNVNMANAISELTAAQTSVQAAAQVFNTLQTSSLLNYLTPSTASGRWRLANSARNR